MNKFPVLDCKKSLYDPPKSEKCLKVRLELFLKNIQVLYKKLELQQMPNLIDDFISSYQYYLTDLNRYFNIVSEKKLQLDIRCKDDDFKNVKEKMNEANELWKEKNQIKLISKNEIVEKETKMLDIGTEMYPIAEKLEICFTNWKASSKRFSSDSLKDVF